MAEGQSKKHAKHKRIDNNNSAVFTYSLISHIFRLKINNFILGLVNILEVKY